MSDLLGGVPSDTMRRVWMAGLAKLCQPGKAEVAAAGLVGMLPALRHVDDVAFNEDTAREIARKNKSGVPSFGVIEPILVTWQQRNRPKVSGAAQISAPEKPAHRMPWELATDWADAAGIMRKVTDIGARMDYAEQSNGMFAPEMPDGPMPVVWEVEHRLALALAACVAKYAPQHLGLLRPDWVAEHQAAMRRGV